MTHPIHDPAPTTPTKAPTHDADLWADEILLDPYPFYSEVRELGPVVYMPHNDVYVLTRYDTVRAALRDWQNFSSAQGIGFNPDVNQALQGTSLASDPPVHTQLRATLGENLSPRALRGLAEVIEQKADELVARLAREGSFEAIDALARAFPLEIVADLIGYTGEAKANMLRWGVAAMEVIGPMNQRTIESFPIAGELYAWCESVTQADLAPGSIGYGIFEAEQAGKIPEGAARHIIHQYLGAGVDTTIASIGNIVALFGRFPEQFQVLREDPALVESAFAEVLRYWPPVHAWGRTVTADTEIEGVLVPAGATAAVLFGAANRDPLHYADPDVFDVARRAGDHLAFGIGPHGCAGQNLARLEGHAVIAALAKHVESFTVGTEVRFPANVTRSISELQVSEVVAA